MQFHNHAQDTQPCIEARLSFNGGHRYFKNIAHSKAECDFCYFSQPTLDSFILSGVFKTQTC